MYHSKMLAILESEPALRAVMKRHADKGTPVTFTDAEQTTLNVTAQARIAEWEAEHRYIEQGFATRSLLDLKNENSYTSSLSPEIAVAWDMRGLETYTFTTMLNRVPKREDR